MNSLEYSDCLRFLSRVYCSLGLILVVAINMILVMTVFCQTQTNSADNGNYALQFDGVNDEVFVGYASNLDIRGDITICLWYKTESTSWGGLVCNYDQYNPDNGYEVTSSSGYDEGGFIYFECAYNDDRDGQSTYASFNDGQWHFVSAIYTPDGSSRGRIFVDGIEQSGYFWGGSVPLPAVGATPEYAFKIGSAYGAARFEGTIDEVRIWNRALIIEEIWTNMYTQLTGLENGLVGYWPFNEGTGNLVNDFSGNANNGTIDGPTWIVSDAPIGTVIISCSPNYGFQNHNIFTTIRSANTHFLEGTKSVWLSKDAKKITADRYKVISNIQIDVKFFIPPDAVPGQWSLNVESTVDSLITMPVGIEVLPPPSITSQSSATSLWLRSVYAINDQTCWSVGNEGSIQKTIDSGITWELQESGTSKVLYSVYFADEFTGWAVGQYGTILSTTNSGADWKSQNSGTLDNLQSVYFIDTNVGWVVGSSGTILKTIDGGLNWESQKSGTKSWLYSTCFLNGNAGWAVGNNGSIVQTSDGGATWNPQISGMTNYLLSVHFVDSNTGWIAGSDGLILNTQDGGTNWIIQKSDTSSWLRSIFFKDLNVGWATGNNGTLMMTTDGGDSWLARKTWTNKTLNSIYYIEDHAGWIVGETGTVLSMVMSNLATQIEEKNVLSSLPQKFQLSQNYPNPFNPRTIINYELPITNDVELSIYNLLGQKLVTLVSERQKAGHHQVEWNASDFSSGVYYYRLSTDAGFVQTKKLVLLK